MLWPLLWSRSGANRRGSGMPRMLSRDLRHRTSCRAGRVAPRGAARAGVLGRGALALGGCAALSRAAAPRYDAAELTANPHAAGRHHPQAGERRARQAVVRHRARQAEHRAGAADRRRARAGSRSPPSGSTTGASMRSTPRRGSATWSSRRPARATCCSTSTASTRPSSPRRSTPRASPTVSGSAARPWCSPGRPRPSCSTTATTARARCGRAMRSSRCSPA